MMPKNLDENYKKNNFNLKRESLVFSFIKKIKMTTLHNDIIINAAIEKIWEALVVVDVLDTYDPTIKKSTAISNIKSGIGAKRKVDMLDGKNWFKEECISFDPHKDLEYKLYACSFPVHSLVHNYKFHKEGNTIRVEQLMKYKMKFGLFGIFMGLMLKPKWNKGINKFLGGLKQYVECD